MHRQTITISKSESMSFKKFMAIWLVLALCTSTFALALPHTQQTPNVYVFREIAGGRELISSGHNVITDIGERYDRNVLGFNNVTSFNATKWISIGNATVSQTLTKLTTEATAGGFERAEATVTSYLSGNDYGYNITITFTSTVQTNLNAAGLHWNPTGNSDNNMYAAYALTGGAATYTVGSKAIIIWLVLRDDN